MSSKQLLISLPLKLIYGLQYEDMSREFKAFIKGQPVKMIKDPVTGQEKWIPIIEEAES